MGEAVRGLRLDDPELTDLRADLAGADGPVELANAQYSLGLYWAQHDALGEAVEAFQAARELFLANDRPVDAANCDLALGTVHSQTGRLVEATKALESARGVFAEHGLPVEVARCDATLGNVDLVEDRFAKARAALMSARVCSPSMGIQWRWPNATSASAGFTSPGASSRGRVRRLSRPVEFSSSMGGR